MTQSLSWEFPYRSQRAPVFARNVVATSQPLATASGVKALAKGGNAVDAILASAITLTVVEPCSNGLGSDAFAIVHDGSRIHGINGSGRSPSAWSIDQFRRYATMPITGWDTVTVPGAVDVWRKLSSRFGSLPFDALFEDAIRYACDGFHVGHKTASQWEIAKSKFADFPHFQKHFCPNGKTPKPGQLFKRLGMVKTLEKIAESNGDEFYSGSLANSIVDQSNREGGCMTMDDLVSHESEWIDPISYSYGGIDLHEIPPNGQGLAALVALGLLDRLDSRSMPIDSADWVHTQVEAMKTAIRIAFDHISDSKSMLLDVQEILDPATLNYLASQITKRANNNPPPILPKSSDTVYLAAADEQGLMVSFIQSNYMGFGSGIVIGDSGIAMQNRGAGFVLEPNHPNVVDGSKRPFHTIIPGFVTRGDESLMAFGVMGGHMQHQGHVQMVTRIFDHHQNPQVASDAPRWHVTANYELMLEMGFDSDVVNQLHAAGHRLSLSENENLFGGAQLILKQSDGSYCAASDHRKEGLAAGF